MHQLKGFLTLTGKTYGLQKELLFLKMVEQGKFEGFWESLKDDGELYKKTNFPFSIFCLRKISNKTVRISWI